MAAAAAVAGLGAVQEVPVLAVQAEEAQAQALMQLLPTEVAAEAQQESMATTAVMVVTVSSLSVIPRPR